MHVFSEQDLQDMREANHDIALAACSRIPWLESLLIRWNIPLSQQEIRPYGASIALLKAMDNV